jgi:arginase
MPLGAALGIEKTSASKSDVDKDTQLKWRELLQLGKNKVTPKITPNNLVFIDIRDLESEETNLIKEKQILHFTPADRQIMGLELIIEKSLTHLAHCHHIYVSFDVDSLDPSISSGTGTPVHGGLSEKEAVNLLKAFWSEPNVFAIEVTEINPLLDRHNPMEDVAANIIAASIR